MLHQELASAHLFRFFVVDFACLKRSIFRRLYQLPQGGFGSREPAVEMTYLCHGATYSSIVGTYLPSGTSQEHGTESSDVCHTIQLSMPHKYDCLCYCGVAVPHPYWTTTAIPHSGLPFESTLAQRGTSGVAPSDYLHARTTPSNISSSRPGSP